MKNIALLTAGLAVTLVTLLQTSPADAIPQTFVASTGGGAACTRALPCATFAAALSAADAGGEIYCLDSGPFGTFGIDKSITIDCNGGSVVASGGVAGLTVSTTDIVVTLRNLTIDGLGTGTTGISYSGGTLIIENCRIQGFRGGASSGIGIRVAPGGVKIKLNVTDSLISNNGLPASGGGIIIKPITSGSALVVLNRVNVVNNTFGIAADGSGSTGGIAVTVTNSTVHVNSQDGILATTPADGAPIGLMVKNSRSISNNIGIRSTGPGVTVRVDGATVMHNGTGLVFNIGGSLLSAGNNMVTANGVNGTFSGTVPLQ